MTRPRAQAWASDLSVILGWQLRDKALRSDAQSGPEGSRGLTDRRKVATWWACLRATAVLNILLWVITCLPLAGNNTLLTWQVALSGVYVGVCAFRSWLPRVDLERYCLVDSPLSSMFVGRSAATVAEVCFAVQVALGLHQVGVIAGVPWIAMASYAVVPPLVVAQVFCWHSVLTLNHLGHAIEASLWTATLAMVGVCSAVAATTLEGTLFWFVAGGATFVVGFVVFMTVVDIPMYVQRWRQARRERPRYLSLREGLQDAWSRRITTRDWLVWRPEAAWLTAYFSVAVWVSLSFVHLARP